MKSFIPICLCSLLSISSFAQDQPHTLKINTLDANNVYKGYLYSSFEAGKVIAKDGTYSKARLNFNCLTNEMVFVSPKNDTLKLARPEETQMVVITSDTFCFFKNTFLKKITHYGSAPELFQRIDMRHVDDEKKSAYGYSALGSNTSVGYVSNDGSASTALTSLSEDKNMVFKRNAEIFIVSDKGEFFSIKQASLNKMYPHQKNQIKNYIETNKLALNKGEDLLKLVEYLQKLETSVPSEG